MAGPDRRKAENPDTDAMTRAIRDWYDGRAGLLARFRRRNRYYYETLERYYRSVIPPGRDVLDLGCGSGEFLAALEPARGVGVDLSPALIERARAAFPDHRFVVADAVRLDLDEEAPFDFILLSNLVGTLADVQGMLRRLRRWVKPETRLVITHFNHLWAPLLGIAERLGWKAPEPDQNWLSLADLDNLLRLEDYEVVTAGQHLLLPLGIPLLSRFVNRFLAGLPGLWRLCLVETVVARPLMPAFVGGVEPACSVVVPARNEKGNLPELVRRVPSMGAGTEIVIVEGGSTDGTWEEACRLRDASPERRIRVIRQEGRGKADAVRCGFAAARGEVLMILDADLTVAPEELPKFFDAVVSGRGELVMGSRLVYPLERESMRLLNLLGNKFFSMAFSRLLGQRIKDTLCGTKAFTRSAYERILARAVPGGDPFGDFSLILGAAEARLRIVEIPVRYRARRYGETQIRRFRHGFMLFGVLLRAFWRLKIKGRG